MDRELSQDEKRQGRLKRWLKLAILPVALLLAVLLFRSLISQTVERGSIRTCVAERGPVQATVSATGTVVPRFEQVISSPISSTILRSFVAAGSRVEPGDQLVLLDREAVTIEHRRVQDELALERNHKEQLALEIKNTSIDLEASYDVKALQTQFIASQYDRAKHLYDLGGATGEDLDRALLNKQIAERELSQLGERITNQKASLEADLRSVDLEIRIREGRLDEIVRQLRLAEMRAESEGVITWVNDSIGAQISSGEPLVRMADLGSYRVEARTSDAHAGKLHTGGEVNIRLGEYSTTGTISSVQPAVANGVVGFIVELNNPSDSILRPNLRAELDIVTGSVDNVIRVENGPFYYGPAEQEVFVVEGDRAVRHMVDIGAANFDWVELKGDIAPGDEVIVSDTRDFRHMASVTLTSDQK